MHEILPYEPNTSRRRSAAVLQTMRVIRKICLAGAAASITVGLFLVAFMPLGVHLGGSSEPQWPLFRIDIAGVHLRVWQALDRGRWRVDIPAWAPLLIGTTLLVLWLSTGWSVRVCRHDSRNMSQTEKTDDQ